MNKSMFHNTCSYVRFILRRERLSIIIWIAALFLITVGQAQSFVDLYPTQEDRQVIAESMDNPAMVAMMGPTYGKENYTLGALMSQQSLLFTAVAVAIMSILFINRNTRGDEDKGRIEIVRSRPTGQLFNLTAAMLVIIVVNIVIGLLMGVGLSSLGIESMDANGSMMYGAVLAATGIIFASITALFAQLFTSSRSTLGVSFAVLGIAYFVRAIGDIGDNGISMISPLGWVMHCEVYVSNYWWPILLTIGVSVIIFAASFYLNSIRDLGDGFFHSKPGRDNASPLLQGPFGLAFRLMRGGSIAWIIAFFVLGASFGSILGDIETQLESNEMMSQMFSYGSGDNSLLDQFVAVLMPIIAMLSTLPVLLPILRLRSEEKDNRIDNIVSRSVSRTRLMGSFFAISMIVSVLIQLVFAVSFWYSGAQVLDDPISLEIILKASLEYLPAMWLMIGVAVALVGCLPRFTIGVWVIYGYSFFVIYLGSILQLDDWMIKISPYGNLPRFPIDDMDFTKIFIIAAIAIVLIVLGFIGYNKRDLQNA